MDTRKRYRPSLTQTDRNLPVSVDQRGSNEAIYFNGIVTVFMRGTVHSFCWLQTKGMNDSVYIFVVLRRYSFQGELQFYA